MDFLIWHLAVITLTIVVSFSAGFFLGKQIKEDDVSSRR